MKFKKVARQAEDQGLRKLYKTELAGCDMAIAYKDSADDAVIQHLPETVNNPSSDFSPIPIKENVLVYGSLKEDKEQYYHRDSLDSVELPVRKFYQATKKGEDWVFDGEWPGPFSVEGVEVANGAFSLDSSHFYFTRCEADWKGKVICKIFVTEKSGGTWGEPTPMDESINMPGYSSSHPTVGRESKKKEEVIYFVSDRPEGKGGTDIWYTQYNTRKNLWKAPRNGGTKVNSPGNEMTPYFHPKTKTLYFSSNGKENFGGMDIFKTTGERSKWEPPTNVGKSINSPLDEMDFALKPSGKGGYFISNRPGSQSLFSETCCFDIYEFLYTDFIELIFDGKLLDESDNNCIDEKSVLKVYIVEGEDKYLAEEKNMDGCKFDVQLRPGFDYILETTTNGYFSGKAEVSTKGIKKSDTLHQDIQVGKIPAEPIVLKDIYYEFDSPKLTDKAKAAIDTTLLKILNDNPEIVIEISSHTDNKGSDSYNLKLSQKRAESVVKYLIDKGIPEARLVAKGYGETMPIAPNEHEDGTDNPDGRAKNRRTEFKIIGTIDTEVIYDDGYDDEEEEKDSDEE